MLRWRVFAEPVTYIGVTYACFHEAGTVPSVND